jgi:flagellar protein FlaI
MVASLDILCVQTLTRFEDERVRRNKVVGEIEGIDQRTGELDYSTAFRWNGNSDTFESTGSVVLDEIRDDRAWDQSDLLEELQNRRRFLEFLQEEGVTDYRRFTSLINQYYVEPESVLDRIESADADNILVESE